MIKTELTKYYKIRFRINSTGEIYSCDDELLTIGQAVEAIRNYTNTKEIHYFIDYVATYPVTII